MQSSVSFTQFLVAKSLPISLGIALIQLATLNAHAEGLFGGSQPLPVDDSARLSMGLNASFNQWAYDQDSDVTVLPQAFYDNNRVYIEGSEAGLYAYKDLANEWRISLGYDGRSFKPSDANDDLLRKLDERKWSALAGTSYMRITPYGGFKAQIETDVLGRSKGTRVKLSHFSRFRLLDERLTVYPEIGVLWGSEDYNQYYYGVSKKEAARTGLPTYDADSSARPFANISASYRINPRWSVFISESLERMSDAQKDSPMVDDNWDSRTKIGFNYQF